VEEATPTFWQFSFETVIPRLLEGMGLTVELTLWSGLFGILLGLGISLARISRSPFLYLPAAGYVTVLRGTPLLLQILFIYFALPPLLDIRLDAMPAGILALSMNAAAYLTEIFRAAIQSIDKGQMEAARALGMGYAVAMRRVILPQTFRRLIPPVVNELAALSKDTSLVSVIALSEMLYVTQRLGAKFLRPWEVYFWAAAGYLLIVVTLSTLAGYLERRLARREA
jgi:His/Glu/Gln/Arg/opine family amino acid ABC transporter permease subunit